MAKTQLKYDLRGVSADKSEVHAAIKDLSKGLFPNAFCKILPDIAGGSVRHANIMHADTAGTKTALAYLHWRETGDLAIWDGIAQDAIVMNLDDMACVGCTKGILLSSTIGRNKHLIPGEVIARLIAATDGFIKKMAAFGVDIHLAGGETADVGDIVRTVDVGFTAFARMARKELIINKLRAGDVIVGLSSFGQTAWENEYNGGMGSNGLTSARHDVLSKKYARFFPESFDPNVPDEVVYTGHRELTEPLEINGKATTVGQLLLSPTRTYLPFLAKFFETHRSKIHGLIHCSGGGQTKVLKFIDSDLRVLKNDLFEPPPLFEMIQKDSKTDWREMYQVFNMGHRLEIYLSKKDAPAAIALAESMGIEAKIIGKVTRADRPTVEIRSQYGRFVWQ